MPTGNFTTAYKEAVAQNITDVIHIETITIDHSSFAEPLRFAKSDNDFVDGANTYKAVQFSISLPEVSSGSSSNINIILTDIDFAITTLIDQIATGLEHVTVLYESFMNTESGPQSAFTAPLEVVQAMLKGRELTLTASYPDLINKKIPALKYTTTLFPGLR